MATKSHKTWQEELAGKTCTVMITESFTDAVIAECRKLRLPAPQFNIVSDRRGELCIGKPLSRRLYWNFFTIVRTLTYSTCVLGGRTAWSATVTIQGQNLAARYWYDGQYLNNAKEDAAEVACTKLRNPSITAGQSTVYRAQSGYGGPWAR